MWAYHEETFVAPEGAVAARFWCSSCYMNTGMGYFDNLMFIENIHTSKVVFGSNVTMNLSQGFHLTKNSETFIETFLSSSGVDSVNTIAKVIRYQNDRSLSWKKLMIHRSI